MKRVLLLFILLSPLTIKAQQSTSEVDLDSLKKEVLALKMDVSNIQINLTQSQSKFKRGIVVATIGYAVTIAGGLMLGRENDDLGKVLLVSGGATGITGTFMMVDAFKYLDRAGKTTRKVE